VTPTELASLEALAKAEPAAWLAQYQIFGDLERASEYEAEPRPLYAFNPAAILSLIEENAAWEG